MQRMETAMKERNSIEREKLTLKRKKFEASQALQGLHENINLDMD